MSMIRALATIAPLAEAQDGLVTAAQAETLGVPRRDLTRLTEGGALERVAHGVYRFRGAPRPQNLELRVAWLQLAPALTASERTLGDGVVSHKSAAVLHEIGLFDPFRHEFSVPSGRRMRSRRDDVRMRSAPLYSIDVTWVDGVLVTTPERTVMDLAAVPIDGDHLADVVSDVLHKDLATEDAVARALGHHATSYGYATGRQMLDYLKELV